jgi:hypothetical protein
VSGIARELAEEQPFRDILRIPARRGGALSLERYSQLLYDHGFRVQVCIEKIYGHELLHTADVIEFYKGTGLRPYLAQLDEAKQHAFLSAYRTRLHRSWATGRPTSSRYPACSSGDRSRPRRCTRPPDMEVDSERKCKGCVSTFHITAPLRKGEGQ